MPVQSTHPAEKLSNLVDEEVKAVLLKAPARLLIEDPVYHTQLTALRNEYRYAYVVQWIYLLRHMIKLEMSFDVETFEEELLGIASPVFTNAFLTKMVLYLANFKLENFDGQINDALQQVSARYYEEYDFIDYHGLDLIGKTELFYNLTQLTIFKSADNLRKGVNQYSKPQHDLRLEPVFGIVEDGVRSDWFVMEDSRVYFRKSEYPEMIVPKNRTEAKKIIGNPLESFSDIEPSVTEWKCVTTGIYQFDDYLKELKQKAGKRTSSTEHKLYTNLKNYIDQVAQHDLKKRRQALQRKREIQMQALLANRKRSSRLEAKERQKHEEDEKKREEEESLVARSAELRVQKRQRIHEQVYQESRSQRLQRRHREADDETKTGSDQGNNSGAEFNKIEGSTITPQQEERESTIEEQTESDVQAVNYPNLEPQSVLGQEPC
ncbi:hypothetical protein OGAPHI_005107 [Ogataea philodendri]|uniref:Uncharacterized protein n=1 Tax=Ogataea philodendri TaxID=1378263 RepID=A0A9P8T2I6_9ASCO|nr:uncharacterized protein OGAPHI_005107 [Ogataea philodendri]KAH3663706.1 hypothetical protein OGAPHI_005107 [Ogataea philodendri]